MDVYGLEFTTLYIIYIYIHTIIDRDDMENIHRSGIDPRIKEHHEKRMNSRLLPSPMVPGFTGWMCGPRIACFLHEPTIVTLW